MAALAETTELHGNTAFSTPRYDLSPEVLDAIQVNLVEDARTNFGEGITAAWISPTHTYANFLRTNEALKFPEVANLDEEYDNAQLFLALIDTRGEPGQVVHAATLMSLREGVQETDEKTGFYTIDSLIERGNFSVKDFLDFYAQRNIDVDKSVSAETNFKIHTKVEPFHGMGTADMVYMMMVNKLLENGATLGRTVVFATANNKQSRSLSRSGLDVDPLLGRTDLSTEEADLGVESHPVAIHVNETSYQAFCGSGVKLPELYYAV